MTITVTGTDRQYRYLKLNERRLHGADLGLPPAVPAVHGYTVKAGKATLRITSMRGSSFGWVSHGSAPFEFPESDREAAIISHVAAVESYGNWDALNAYDNVAPSLGPLQACTRWGVLQDILWELWIADTQTYTQLLGQHGYWVVRCDGLAYIVREQASHARNEYTAWDAYQLKQLEFCRLLVVAAQHPTMQAAILRHAKKRLAAVDVDARKFGWGGTEKERAVYFTQANKFGPTGARKHFAVCGAKTAAGRLKWALDYWRRAKRIRVIVDSEVLE